MMTACLSSIVTLSSVILTPNLVLAQYQPDEPRPIPLTRPEMKQMLEDVKRRTPRIPLPELTQEQAALLGERADNYEARLRYHYLGDEPSGNRLPAAAGASSGTNRTLGRNADPNMTLDYAFKVELFWIVSRTNNCQYCLGHQESKLLGAGLSEERIASLDGQWLSFSPKEKAAYGFARRITLEPHLIADTDINELRQHFHDRQIIEMLLSIAWNNSINRWKEGVGVPQHADEGGYSRMVRAGTLTPEAAESLPTGSYLTATPAAFQKSVSKVAPVHLDELGKPTTCVLSKRPPLESREEVLAKFSECRERTSRLPMLDVAESRKALELASEEVQVENWMRLLAHFPNEGKRRMQATLDASQARDLSPVTLAQISWIVGRQDRAWYAVERAYRQLKSLGQSDDEVFALDGDWENYSDRDQVLFQIARDLAASPVVLTDEVVANGIESAGAAEVVQAIQHVTQCAAFNRITEAAGLPADLP